jgi:hypothetical protein
MKITIELTEDSSGKFHADCERNKKLLDKLGPVDEGMAACGVLRYLALHVWPEECEDLVQHGFLIVAERVQAANKASLGKLD